MEQEVEPVWRDIEEDDTIPDAVLRKAADVGLFGFSIPEAYGGLGLPMVARALVYEELGHTRAGFTSVVGLHCGIGTSVIVQLGSERQKQRCLPRLASGEWLGAFALTEPGAGSDAAAISTTAERKGDRWVINGAKHFITNSLRAQVFTVFARPARPRPAAASQRSW